jgi:hypothetical protein
LLLASVGAIAFSPFLDINVFILILFFNLTVSENYGWLLFVREERLPPKFSRRHEIHIARANFGSPDVRPAPIKQTVIWRISKASRPPENL